ncbi:hypothetical protein J6590_047886 [Homalodisca vitripennis]|nr:hypothetical protein J6590_047886 [Homalodisca vitripennis]
MNPSPFERNTFWTIAFGSIFIWIPQLAVHPSAMQRFIAVSSFKKAKAVMFWSVIGFLTIYGLVLIIGLLLYATYHDCDPVASGVVEKTGQLVPYYVMEVAHDYPGLTGLFISGVLSAALSSISSGLNTVAGTMYEDFVVYVLKGEKLSETRQNLVTKILVLVLGLLYILGVFVIERLGAIFQMVQSLVGATNGSLSGLFTLGIFFPQANATGAIAGTLTSLVVMSMVVFGAQVYSVRGLLRYPGKMTSVTNCSPDLIKSLPFNATSRCDTYTGIGSPVIADPSVPLIFQLSYLYYCLLGMVIVLVVGLAVSYISGPTDARHLDPQLFSPPVRHFLPKKGIMSIPENEEYKLVKTSDMATNNNTDGKRNSIL